LRRQYDRVVAGLWHGAAIEWDYLVGRKAVRVGFPGAVGIDGCGEVEFRAIVQFERLHSRGFAGCAGTEEAGLGPAVEGDGNSFR
jgi:hypothetical protein